MRERTHWNAPNIKPQNPVNLGLCSSADLEKAITLARTRARNALARAEKAAQAAIEAETQAAEAAQPAEKPAPEAVTEAAVEKPELAKTESPGSGETMS